MKTNEGAIQKEHSLDHCVEFFSKAGSIYDTPTKNTFYSNSENILQLFVNAWITDNKTTFKLLLWVRDCRGGAGNRSGFRKCLGWLALNEPEWIKTNIDWIAEIGRWDDLRTLFGTACEAEAVSIWFKAILFDGNKLAAKWAKRTDIPLYLEYKDLSVKSVNMGDFRRFLSKHRDTVETKMCDKQWKKIIYKHVPSVAMSRYTKAFKKHDEEGFEDYKDHLKKGETKINASVLFPHDCVRTVKNGDKDIANAQFDALPNYMNTDENIMVLCDSSGSMEQGIGGSIEAIDISMGLALYCSGKMPESSPFYKKFIQFKSESKLTDWKGISFDMALNPNRGVFDGAVGVTRIDKALDLILNTASMFNVGEDNMPKMLLICSDMQFSDGTIDNWTNRHINLPDYVPETEVERSLKKWDVKGYNRPKIVYWNLCPYGGQPDTVKSKNIALVSGFSPSILKSVLSCDDFSPRAIMMKTLEEYHIKKPE